MSWGESGGGALGAGRGAGGGRGYKWVWGGSEAARGCLAKGNGGFGGYMGGLGY